MQVDTAESDESVLPCAPKLAFDTQQQAAATANVVHYRYGSKVKPYICQYCGLWHLSSNSE